MSKDAIKDKYNRLVGYIETLPDGKKKAFDKYNRPLSSSRRTGQTRQLKRTLRPPTISRRFRNRALRRKIPSLLA
jgi:hypothetical protein